MVIFNGKLIKTSKVQILGVSEFDASDIGPREAYVNYQERKSDLDQFQLIGTWDNNEGLFMESLKFC